MEAIEGAGVIEALWEDIEGGFKDGESIWISSGSSEDTTEEEEEEEKAYRRLLPIRHIRLSRVFSAVRIFLASSLTVCFLLVFSPV